MSEDLIKIRNQIMALAEEYFILKEKDKIFIENISSIPVSGKVLDNKDLINLIQSSLDMWLTAGEFTEKFEKAISAKTGIRHTLFVNSGSSANLLAITALKEFYNLQDGDEVITSAVNFPTTLNPIIQSNLKTQKIN